MSNHYRSSLKDGKSSLGVKLVYLPGVFYSIDRGKSFQQTSFYIWVGRYDLHDNEGNHLLGFASENSQIVESKDGGKTWKNILSLDHLSK